MNFHIVSALMLTFTLSENGQAIVPKRTAHYSIPLCELESISPSHHSDYDNQSIRFNCQDGKKCIEKISNRHYEKGFDTIEEVHLIVINESNILIDVQKSFTQYKKT